MKITLELDDKAIEAIAAAVAARPAAAKKEKKKEAVDKATVIKAAQAFAAKHGTEAARKISGAYGERFADIKESDYPALLADYKAYSK